MEETASGSSRNELDEGGDLLDVTYDSSGNTVLELDQK